jgi:hypothetical protein
MTIAMSYAMQTLKRPVFISFLNVLSALLVGTLSLSDGT